MENEEQERRRRRRRWGGGEEAHQEVAEGPQVGSQLLGPDLLKHLENSERRSRRRGSWEEYE